MNFLKYLYEGYIREKFLEKPRFIFQKNTEYVLFSGTALGDTGDIRHLNDLYFILFLLKQYQISKNNIVLSVDIDILTELNNNPNYNKFYRRIHDLVGKIISPESFQNIYTRNSSKNLVFIASGHGDIGGLCLTKSNSFLNSDYFEDISSKSNDTLLIMSQCYAGAFHHLDTRKNICVLASSEYQESLSLNIMSLITTQDNQGKHFFKDHIDVELGNFILNELSFDPKIHSINPFLFSLFLVLLEPNKYIISRKKHLINVYKHVVSITTQNLSNTYQHVKIQTLDESYHIEGIRIIQQSYILNKIIASRFYITEGEQVKTS